MSESIREFFGDGGRLGMRLKYIEQPSVLGTGNAAGVAEPYVENDFLLVYGDLLFSSEAVKSVQSLFNNEKPVAAMALVPVDNPESYGIIQMDKNHRVIGVIEKPSREKAPSKLANTGLYAFSSEIFDEIRKIKSSVRGELELTDALSLLIKRKAAVLATEISKNDWIDIGRPWDLLEANSWALKRMKHKVLGEIEEGAHILGPVSIAETARIRSGAYIEGPTIIDEGSDIGPNCYIRPCTSIGKKVRVGNAVEVKNSIVMDGTHIGHLSYVGDSVIGEKCNFGAGTITANYRLDSGTVKMVIKDSMVDSGRRKLGAILGDEVKTGINTLTMPGVKIGFKSCIGPNYIVYRDVAANTTVLLSKP
jgi:bifunctional UDP-N-acetylglucosamine pyrophosphorylase/glucosamine-1-phosphate N-acetyltransferase